MQAQEYTWYFLGVVTVLITVEAPQLQCFNKVVDVYVVLTCFSSWTMTLTCPLLCTSSSGVETETVEVPQLRFIDVDMQRQFPAAAGTAGLVHMEKHMGQVIRPHTTTSSSPLPLPSPPLPSHPQTTHTHTATTTSPPGVSAQTHFLCGLTVSMTQAGNSNVARTGATRRRWERRLRSMLRHERQTVAMELAAALHHSRDVGPGTNDGLRAQTTASPGKRPAPLGEVAEPQVKLVQHSGIGYELVQALDLPVLQVVEPPVGVVKFFSKSLAVVAEQVIEVPKLPLPDGYSQRVVPPEPQMAQQLVDVPTVHCFVEQTVYISGVSGAPGHGSPQGFLPRQSSSATAEQTAVNPVPRGRGARGGLQGFPQGRGASQRTVEQSVDTPVPGRGAPSGRHGLHPRQSSSQRTVEQTTDIPVPGRGGHLGTGFNGVFWS